MHGNRFQLSLEVRAALYVRRARVPKILLTGLFVHRHGTDFWNHFLPAAKPTGRRTVRVVVVVVVVVVVGLL